VRTLLALAAAVAVGAAAAGCGADGDAAVARVGTAKVTREQLEQTVEHFREESRREGRPFAADSRARRNLVGLLVYRTRIEEGAAALGITVSDEQVEQRLGGAPAEGDEADAEAFLKSTVRTQLLTEAVYRTLADRIHDTDPQRRQARRNAALRRWIASLATRYPARVSE
jgi:hypothetical protein